MARSTMMMSPSSSAASTIDTPFTLKKKVDALCFTSRRIKSSFSRISSAGDGNPAFTSPNKRPSKPLSSSILCGMNSSIIVLLSQMLALLPQMLQFSQTIALSREPSLFLASLAKIQPRGSTSKSPLMIS